MAKRRSRTAPGLSFVVEALDSRIVLSGTGGALQAGVAEIAGQAVKKAATTTTLAASAGTIGQPVTFSVTVHAAAKAGSPTGTVNLVDHGQVIGTLTLSPSSTTNAKTATSVATSTLTPQPGGGAYYFGKHEVSAVYVPAGSFLKSSASKSFAVGQPDYTTLSGGVKVATVTPGSGTQILSGQTANVLYTGFLAKNGKIFDDSLNDGGTPLSFTLGAGQVVPGFDAGTVGMLPGETRAILIPAAEGYGTVANGPIPANSTLLFLVTLESAS